jgi:hypothetical protein
VSDGVRAGCGGGLLAWLYERRPFPLAKVSPCNGDFLAAGGVRVGTGRPTPVARRQIGLEYW